MCRTRFRRRPKHHCSSQTCASCSAHAILHGKRKCSTVRPRGDRGASDPFSGVHHGCVERFAQAYMAWTDRVAHGLGTADDGFSAVLPISPRTPLPRNRPSTRFRKDSPLVYHVSKSRFRITIFGSSAFRSRAGWKGRVGIPMYYLSREVHAFSRRSTNDGAISWSPWLLLHVTRDRRATDEISRSGKALGVRPIYHNFTK